MGNGAVVPLSGQSVFVTASEQHDGLENGNARGEGVSAGTTGNDPTSSNAARRPRIAGHRASNSFSRPRRSRAHQPTLLGLGLDEIGVANEVDGSNEAREAVMLTGLGIHASTSTPSGTLPPTTQRKFSSKGRLSTHVVEEEQEAEEEEDYDERQFRIGSDTEDPMGEEQVNSLEEGRALSTAHIDGFDNSRAPAPDDHDERTLFGYDQDYEDDELDELDDVEAGLRGSRAVKLPFEAITFREQIWMWTSVAMVVALSMVSLAIAVDWIDWPGDGIGKQR